MSFFSVYYDSVFCVCGAWTWGRVRWLWWRSAALRGRRLNRLSAAGDLSLDAATQCAVHVPNASRTEQKVNFRCELFFLTTPSSFRQQSRRDGVRHWTVVFGSRIFRQRHPRTHLHKQWVHTYNYFSSHAKYL